MRTRALLVAAPILLALPACRMNERLSGTILGGVGGAAIGAAAGGVGGAFVGGGVGALGGYLVGDYLADQRERGRPSVFGDIDDAPSGPRMAALDGPGAGAVMGVRDSAAASAYERGRRSTGAAEAQRHFEEALRIDPRHAPSWNALGLAAAIRGDRARAEACFHAALRADPSNADARAYLARLPAARS